MAVENVNVNKTVSNAIGVANTDGEVPGCHINVLGDQVKIMIPKNRNAEPTTYIFSKKEVKTLMESLYMET